MVPSRALYMMMTEADKGRVLYVHHTFPTLTQTFVWREMKALVEQGLDLASASVKRPPPQQVA